MFDLTGKTALVTGASGGIGGAIAKALHAQGATVVLSGTRAEALESLKSELGERAFTVATNLSNPADVEELPKKAEAADSSTPLRARNASAAAVTAVVAISHWLAGTWRTSPVVWTTRRRSPALSAGRATSPTSRR